MKKDMLEQQEVEEAVSTTSMNGGASNMDEGNLQVSVVVVQEPKLYLRRWFQLMIFAFCMLTSIICMSTYTSSGTLLMTFYQLGNDENWKINMMGLIFLIVNIPGSYTVSFILKRFGLKWSFAIFSILTCLGACIRLVGIQGNEVSYWLSFIGQTLIACGQPFITQCGDLFGVHWFGNKERTVVQVVVLIAGVFGSLLAYAIGPRLMTVGSESNENLKISELGIGIFLGIQAALATLCVGFVLIFFKSKPPTPPVGISGIQFQNNNDMLSESLVEVSDNQENFNSTENIESTQNYKKVEEPKDIYPPQTFMFGLKKLLRTPSFFMLLAASSLINSVFQSIYILEQIIKTNKYTAIDAGNLNVILIVFATISSIVLSILFDKTKQFKLITTITSLSACFSFIWFCVLMFWEKNDVLLVLSGISFVLIGIFSVPNLPLLSQMIVYTTYPVHPSTTLTVTSTFTTIWSIIFMVYVNVLQLTTPLAPTIILWTDFALFVIAFLLIASFRGRFSPVLVDSK